MKTPFRYDFVGSFLRPQRLKDARKDFEEGKITQADLTKVEDECIVDLVNKIKGLGYHVITDGEFRRSTWHLDFMWGFEGIEHQKTVEGNTTFDAEAAMIDDTYMTGKISVKNHPFAICVLNICFVILMPIYLDFAVPGNSFSFCCHFSTSKCNQCCIFVLPKPHDLLKGAICFLAHFGRLLSFPQVLPDRCI